jgi:enoyl-CoA hydratase/carnithine racemase
VAGEERPLTEALHEADRLYLDELMSLRDPHEGLAAFMEKRAPQWRDA